MLYDLIKEGNKRYSNHESSVLVTVILTQGSTPGKVGATMLVGEDGLLGGTVGGGKIEYEAIKQAVKCLKNTKKEVAEYVLDNDKAGALGMVCGGTTKLLFTLFTPIEVKPPLNAIVLYLENSPPECIESESRYPKFEAEKGCVILPFYSGGRVFLIGGGHVAKELSFLLERLDFPYFVVDDREEFCNENRFSGAELAQVTQFDDLNCIFTDEFKPREGDGFCIMTRGHEGDFHAVEFALSTKASYIGVMGSARKRGLLLQKLGQNGISDHKNRIKTPIGLKIDAVTPAELAVSVAAELIAWRNGGE